MKPQTNEVTKNDFDAAVVDAVRAVVGPGEVALHEPQFAGREWEYVRDCLDTGWVSSVGTYVDRFESMLAEYTGAGHVVAVNNGTAALHTCLMLANVGAGDEVLIPALTFVATTNVVRYVDATPHFVDIDLRTMGVAAARLEAHLDETTSLQAGVRINRQTGRPIRALICVHAFGHPADVEGLLALAERFNLVLIEDAAESLGSLHKGRHTGTFGRLGTLSFNGNKIVTTGGGGAIITSDPGLAARAKHLTTTARSSTDSGFMHDQVGFNYRLPNINAALGCAQLEQLDGFVERKRKLAASYREAFADLSGVQFVGEPDGARSNYWLNAILLDPEHSDRRDALLERSNAAGIATRPAWTLMHELPMYRGCPRMDLRVAEDVRRRLINLPSSASLA